MPADCFVVTADSSFFKISQSCLRETDGRGFSYGRLGVRHDGSRAPGNNRAISYSKQEMMESSREDPLVKVIVSESSLLNLIFVSRQCCEESTPEKFRSKHNRSAID